AEATTQYVAAVPLLRHLRLDPYLRCLDSSTHLQHCQERRLLPFHHDLINKSIFHSFMRLQNVIAIGIAIDFLGRLASVFREDLVHSATHTHDVLGVNVDLRRLTAESSAHDERLMNDHARIWVSKTFPISSCLVLCLGHRCG